MTLGETLWLIVFIVEQQWIDLNTNIKKKTHIEFWQLPRFGCWPLRQWVSEQRRLLGGYVKEEPGAACQSLL